MTAYYTAIDIEALKPKREKAGSTWLVRALSFLRKPTTPRSNSYNEYAVVSGPLLAVLGCGGFPLAPPEAESATPSL